MINRKLRRAKKKRDTPLSKKKKNQVSFSKKKPVSPTTTPGGSVIASVSVSSVKRLQKKKKENVELFVHLPKQDLLVTILLKAVV